MNAVKAGYRAFTSPDTENEKVTREERAKLYAHAWAYYRNKMFSRRNGENWSAYLSARELYKHTRLIYNPVTSVVDFYVDHIWQGSGDAVKTLDSGLNLVTPVSSKVDDDALLDAVAQLDQWSNWQSESPRVIRYGASAGNVLIEGIDDLQREKITQKTIWAGLVYEIELNDSGDVQSYVIEYDVQNGNESYRYRKVVTKESFSYFKNDKPFTPEGKTGSEEMNPYGFCPAVWVKHIDDGGDYGTPCFTSLDKVDEVNSLASHTHDNIHKSIESAKVLSTEGEVVPIIGGIINPQTKQIAPSDPRLHWVVLKTPQGATVHDLAGNLHLAEAHPYLKDALASFSDDYPELQAHTVIKQNSQLSGAALERMLAPSQSRLDRACANYNQQLIKLRQMQAAIAGWRINGGGWKMRTEQQEFFRPFNLKSFERGDLNFSIKRSLLVQPTESEQEDLLTKKAARANTSAAFVDTEEQLKIAGYTDEEAEIILTRKGKETTAQPVE